MRKFESRKDRKILQTIFFYLIVLLIISVIPIVSHSALTADYFPLAIGNSWKFKNRTTGEIATSQITDSKTINGKETYILTTSNNCKDCNNIAYFAKTNSDISITYSIGQNENLFLKFPSETGANWEITTKENKIIRTEIINEETVNVPAGTFNSYKIKTSIRIKDAKDALVVFYNWYSQNIGWVKGQKEGKEIWELIEYQIK